MKRYSMIYEGGHNGELAEDSDGEYVRYEDAQQAIDKELDDGATLSNRLTAVNEELQRQLIAAETSHLETLEMGEKLLAATSALQRQLAEVTAERDQLRILLEAADALRNAERSKIVTRGNDPDVLAVQIARRKTK